MFFHLMLYIFEITLKDHQMVQQEDMNVKQYQLIEQLVDHVQLILIHISIMKKKERKSINLKNSSFSRSLFLNNYLPH
jgi:hypothetical protein